MWAGEEVSSSPTVQTIDTPPIASVETLGVWKRGWTRAKAFGSAPQFAIEIVVRAVGRIVVWVDADAEVSTGEQQELLQHAGAEHAGAEGAENVVRVGAQELRAGVGLRGGRDEQVDQHEQDRREHRRAARSLGRVLRLLVDRDARVPAPVDEDPEQDAADQRAAC